MARYKNHNWGLPEKKIETWEQVQVALLMDIRDELQMLNRSVNSSWFCRVKSAVERIDKRIAKKVKLK